jgi:PrgI family protein
MAQYKVLQDIEAEDKLVGPLTLRQFIYACITAVCLYLCFVGVIKHFYVMIPIFLLPGMLTGFFAFPFGRDQPTEIWALAKIRFLFKPRMRVWDQSGVKELVTITAPKKVEVNYTNGLSQTEVRSRLRALADTIDTRGWAIKNVTNGLYQPALPSAQGSERLIDFSTFPQEVPAVDDRATSDMLDEQTSPVAQTFDTMMRKSDQEHRQRVVQSMTQTQQPPANQPTPTTNQQTDQMEPQLPAPQPLSQQVITPSAPPDNFWFMGQQPAMPSAQAQVVTPGAPAPAVAAAEPTAEEKVLAEQLREQNNSQGISHAHLHTILPLSEQKALAQEAEKAAAAAKAKAAQAPPMTQQPDPAIIALASNNDLNVATIARQANKRNQQPPDEVVISLH